MSKKRIVTKKVHTEELNEKAIRKLEQKIRRLESEKRSLEIALRKNEEYLIAISTNKTLESIFQEIKDKTDVKIKQDCPKCGSQHMKKINLGTVKVVACIHCDYRNRINESGISQA